MYVYESYERAKSMIIISTKKYLSRSHHFKISPKMYTVCGFSVSVTTDVVTLTEKPFKINLLSIA